MHKRPLSPHIQIYRWQWTMVGSILHRMSGIILSACLPLGTLALWLMAFEPAIFDIFVAYSHSLIAQIITFFAALAFCYHISNGIRHLLWDTGLFLDLHKAKWGAYIVWVNTVILTLVILYISH